MHNNRTHHRLSFQKECVLLSRYGVIKGVIKCKTINMSKNGAELRLDKIFPYKKRGKLRIYDTNMRNPLRRRYGVQMRTLLMLPV